MTSRTRLIAILISAPVIAFAVIGGLLGNVMARTDDTYAHLRVFQDVVSLIMSNYVEQPNMDSVMRGAMRGLAEGLDSDSAFLTPAAGAAGRKRRSDRAGRCRHRADASVLPARRGDARRLPCRQGGHSSRRFRPSRRFAAHARHVGLRGTASARRRGRLEGQAHDHPGGSTTEPHIVELTREAPQTVDVKSRQQGTASDTCAWPRSAAAPASSCARRLRR